MKQLNLNNYVLSEFVIVIRRSISKDDGYVNVTFPFLTAGNIFKFDCNTSCLLVRYTVHGW